MAVRFWGMALTPPAGTRINHRLELLLLLPRLLPRLLLLLSLLVRHIHLLWCPKLEGARGCRRAVGPRGDRSSSAASDRRASHSWPPCDPCDVIRCWKDVRGNTNFERERENMESIWERNMRLLSLMIINWCSGMSVAFQKCCNLLFCKCINT